ncbi:MAG: hypothetical protein M3N53_06415 [Actinomycetota bacterium]|nr:hypothetical protein [Actinomycetota bacterium]
MTLMELAKFYAHAKRKESGEIQLARKWTSAADPGAAFHIFWVIDRRGVRCKNSA